MSHQLQFHDVYSLTASELTHIPRPCLALLVIFPLTREWNANREAEDAPLPAYNSAGPNEPVVWFKQTIGHACGSIGLLHCMINGQAQKFVVKDSVFEKIREKAVGLKREERAQMLYDCKEFEDAHQSVARMGDTAAPSAEEGDRLGQHFVSFVKGEGGQVWELEGSRKGPIKRMVLAEGEDLLSERALEGCVGRVIKLAEEMDPRFSVIALCLDEEDAPPEPVHRLYNRDDSLISRTTASIGYTGEGSLRRQQVDSMDRMADEIRALRESYDLVVSASYLSAAGANVFLAPHQEYGWQQCC